MVALRLCLAHVGDEEDTAGASLALAWEPHGLLQLVGSSLAQLLHQLVTVRIKKVHNKVKFQSICSDSRTKKTDAESNPSAPSTCCSAAGLPDSPG